MTKSHHHDPDNPNIILFFPLTSASVLPDLQPGCPSLSPTWISQHWESPPAAAAPSAPPGRCLPRGWAPSPSAGSVQLPESYSAAPGDEPSQCSWRSGRSGPSSPSSRWCGSPWTGLSSGTLPWSPAGPPDSPGGAACWPSPGRPWIRGWSGWRYEGCRARINGWKKGSQFCLLRRWSPEARSASCTRTGFSDSPWRGTKLIWGANRAFIEADKPPTPQQRGHRVGQRGGWVDMCDRHKKGEWRGGLHDTQKSCMPGIVCVRQLNLTFPTPPPPPPPATDSLPLASTFTLFLSVSSFQLQLNEKEFVWRALVAGPTWPHMCSHRLGRQTQAGPGTSTLC